MTVTLPEWLVGIALALWCLRCAAEWRMAVWKYRLETEQRRCEEHGRG